MIAEVALRPHRIDAGKVFQGVGGVEGGIVAPLLRLARPQFVQGELTLRLVQRRALLPELFAYRPVDRVQLGELRLALGHRASHRLMLGRKGGIVGAGAGFRIAFAFERQVTANIVAVPKVVLRRFKLTFGLVAIVAAVEVLRHGIEAGQLVGLVIDLRGRGWLCLLLPFALPRPCFIDGRQLAGIEVRQPFAHLRGR